MDTSEALIKQKAELKHLRIDLLQRGKFQPRQTFSSVSLDALASTIKRDGVLEPLIVRPQSDSKNSQKFEIIAGERRWRAAQLAGLSDVPCLVRYYSDEEAARISLTENLQREDLNPVEEAIGIKKLKATFNYTDEELGAILGKSRSVVTNLMRLLELDNIVQELLRAGELAEIHGRLLAGIPRNKQLHYARLTIKNGWSSRSLEKEIKKNVTQNQIKTVPPQKDKNILRLEKNLSNFLGYPAKIFYDSKGSGYLNVEFTNIEQLEGILEKVGFGKDD